MRRTRLSWLAAAVLALAAPAWPAVLASDPLNTALSGAPEELPPLWGDAPLPRAADFDLAAPAAPPPAWGERAVSARG